MLLEKHFWTTFIILYWRFIRAQFLQWWCAAPGWHVLLLWKWYRKAWVTWDWLWRGLCYPQW